MDWFFPQHPVLVDKFILTALAIIFVVIAVGELRRKHPDKKDGGP